MSKLDELIKELCPNGVEFITLGTCCNIKTGKGITKKDGTDNGSYPIISGGKEPMGYFNTYNREKNTVTVSRVGANAGYVSYIETPFYLNDKCFSIIPWIRYVEKIDCKFLYYVLKSLEPTIIAMQSEGGVPTINTVKVGSIEIPLPPLPIQQEIVRILDSFTELTAELQQQLDAELTARKKQYEYYRELVFENTKRNLDTRILPLANAANVFRGEYITKKDTIEGNIPVILGGQEPAYYINKSNHDGEIVVIARSGASAGFVSYWNEPIFVTDGFGYEAQEEIVFPRYLYHCLKGLETNLNAMKRGAGVPHVSGDALSKVELPIPPLEEQERIVAILDRFDALCNDLSSGLPAEIEARQKQYEYYRDKLLSFPPAE